jgi:hypothetical protein
MNDRERERPMTSSLRRAKDVDGNMIGRIQPA